MVYMKLWKSIHLADREANILFKVRFPQEASLPKSACKNCSYFSDIPFWCKKNRPIFYSF